MDLLTMLLLGGGAAAAYQFPGGKNFINNYLLGGKMDDAYENALTANQAQFDQYIDLITKQAQQYNPMLQGQLWQLMGGDPEKMEQFQWGDWWKEPAGGTGTAGGGAGEGGNDFGPVIGEGDYAKWRDNVYSEFAKPFESHFKDINKVISAVSEEPVKGINKVLGTDLGKEDFDLLHLNPISATVAPEKTVGAFNKVTGLDLGKEDWDLLHLNPISATVAPEKTVGAFNKVFGTDLGKEDLPKFLGGGKKTKDEWVLRDPYQSLLTMMNPMLDPEFAKTKTAKDKAIAEDIQKYGIKDMIFDPTFQKFEIFPDYNHGVVGQPLGETGMKKTESYKLKASDLFPDVNFPYPGQGDVKYDPVTGKLSYVPPEEQASKQKESTGTITTERGKTVDTEETSTPRSISLSRDGRADVTYSDGKIKGISLKEYFPDIDTTSITGVSLTDDGRITADVKTVEPGGVSRGWTIKGENYSTPTNSPIKRLGYNKGPEGVTGVVLIGEDNSQVVIPIDDIAPEGIGMIDKISTKNGNILFHTKEKVVEDVVPEMKETIPDVKQEDITEEGGASGEGTTYDPEESQKKFDTGAEFAKLGIEQQKEILKDLQDTGYESIAGARKGAVSSMLGLSRQMAPKGFSGFPIGKMGEIERSTLLPATMETDLLPQEGMKDYLAAQTANTMGQLMGQPAINYPMPATIQPNYYPAMAQQQLINTGLMGLLGLGGGGSLGGYSFGGIGSDSDLFGNYLSNSIFDPKASSSMSSMGSALGIPKGFPSYY